MPELWYALLALMLTAYAVLDGFDFGAGILHLFVARNESERREVFAAIGPFWDGNEVWLIGAGGVMFLAFPVLLATAFPAFYLSLFVVLWCLLLRGIAIELRSHVNNAEWRTFWDAVFALSSALLALLFGVALGNVVRGLPLDAEEVTTLPLFTDFGVSGRVGLIDWYTLLVGVFSVGLLTSHGALFLQYRSRSDLTTRAHRVERALRWPLLGLFIGVSVATHLVRPDFFVALATRPLAWFALGIGLVGGVLASREAGQGGRRFVGSCLRISGLLGALAVAVFPTLLRSTLDPAHSLTLGQAMSGDYSRRVALFWWPLAFVLAVAYLALAFWTHRAPVTRE
ncbi:MAG TPA: cytochrome d ubiquinol oxidase subunit II [Polyangiaceae bacterium]|nr:cytochrome d ubiquinol oxidase subunit II [Polyangiaceae bacterium]